MRRLLILLPMVVLACGDDATFSHDGAVGGTGGISGNGGSGGFGAGGSAGGSGGSGAGGSAGGSGGSGAGGSAGASGASGGGGNFDAAAGAGGGAGADGGAIDGPSTDVQPAPGVDTAPPNSSVDECFAGVRTGQGSWQDATKANASGTIKLRLALETADRFGTSGTKPWAAYAVAVTTPTGSVCMTEQSALASAYMTTHHNCMDVLTITQGNRKYVIRNPDSAIDSSDPNRYVRTATLTIFEGANQVGSPIILETIACNRSSTGDNICRSGGPC